MTLLRGTPAVSKFVEFETRSQAVLSFCYKMSPGFALELADFRAFAACIWLGAITRKSRVDFRLRTQSIGFGLENRRGVVEPTPMSVPCHESALGVSRPKSTHWRTTKLLRNAWREWNTSLPTFVER